MLRGRLAMAIIFVVALLSTCCAPSIAYAQQGPAGTIVYSMPLESGLQQVRLIRPDGTDDRAIRTDLSTVLFPTWSRDGKWIAATGARSDQDRLNVFVFDAAGGSLRPVTDLNIPGAALFPLFKAFSPNGQRLAVAAVGQASRQDPVRGNITTNVATLLVVSRDRPGEPTVVGGVADVGGTLQGVGVDWSPTADQLIVPAPALDESSGLPLPVTALFTVPPEENAFGQGLAHQVTSPQRALDRSADDAMPAFSPDGQRIAFVRREVRGQRFTASIRVVDADGGNEQQVIGLPQGDVVNSVSWSGDGKSLVFDWGRAVSNTVLSDPATTGLWTIGVDGSNLTQLKAPPALGPSWSWAR